MPHLPDATRFLELAKSHNLIPVYRRLLSDEVSPVAAFHKLDDGGELALFESVVGGERVGRWTFLAVHPFISVRAYGNEVSITALTEDGKPGKTEKRTSKNPVLELRSLLSQYKSPHLPDLPPFIGGAVGYAGYDVIRYSEQLENPPPDDRKLPDLSFALHDQLIAFDNINKAMYVIALAHLDGKIEPMAAYAKASRAVDKLVERLSAPGHELSMADIPYTHDSEMKSESNFPRPAFEDAVRKCVEYIKAGDIFQVVISQRIKVAINCDPFEIYRTLRVVNPSPFMFLLRTPEATLVGSSPEIMCRVLDRQVTVRPLAGTRARGTSIEEDQRLEKELLADPKERAEHVMLVDLGRNDVGRVAKFGSVQISDVMKVERYSHVMHISSQVTGELRDELDAFDAMASCLPAGTLSGAPKVRAMEIIDEVEPHRRGPYGGAVGYIDYVGNMDTCIALRTIVVQNGTAFIQAGAGIVADSVPSEEYQETLNKARGLLKAVALTESRCAMPPK
jgi:anthranilate synthase component 1